MASGMGIPSMAIYSNELYNVFGVENIIRIGSAGAMQPGLRLRDIVVALGASTDSDYAKTFHLPGTFAPVCSYKLLRLATDLLEKSGASYAVGSLLSSDAFYTFEDELPPEMRSTPAWQRMGILAVDMEAAGLYMNAARAGKNALAICTVSDQLVTDEHLSAADRETGFSEMVTLALDMAAELGFKKLLFTGHIGKLVKVSGGIMNTHSKEGDCRMELIAAAAIREGVSADKLQRILDCVVTEEALRILQEGEDTFSIRQERKQTAMSHDLPSDMPEQVAVSMALPVMNRVMNRIMDRIMYHLRKRAQGRLEIECVMYSNDFGELARSKGAEEWLTLLAQEQAQQI